MDELKRQEKIQELERQIAGLPIGYISKKTINGNPACQKCASPSWILKPA